jgi:hypothetical protein
LLVWIDGQGVKAQLLPFGEPQLLSISANRQFAPSIAVDDDGQTLLVWQEATGVYAMRVSPNGRTLDGRGLELSSAGSAPKVVFDGRQFVVAWLDWRGLEVRFVSPHSGHVQHERMYVPRVASGARAPGLSVFARDGRIWAMRDSASFPVSPEGMQSTMPAVAGDLVVWSERVRVAEHGEGYVWEPHRIHGVRLSVDSAPLLIGDTPLTEDTYPTVAVDGDGWLVAWTGRNGDAVMTARVQPNGMVSEQTELAVGYGAVAAPNGDVAYKTWPHHVLHLGELAIETRSSQREIAVDGDSIAYVRVSEEHGGVERVFIRRSSSPAWPSPETGRSRPYR